MTIDVPSAPGGVVIANGDERGDEPEPLKASTVYEYPVWGATAVSVYDGEVAVDKGLPSR